MSIIVNPHNLQEEKALIEFLEKMKFDYSQDNDLLTEAQQKEILDRDRQYEAGEAEVFTLDEVIARFADRKSNV